MDLIADYSDTPPIGGPHQDSDAASPPSTAATPGALFQIAQYSETPTPAAADATPGALRMLAEQYPETPGSIQQQGFGSPIIVSTLSLSCFYCCLAAFLPPCMPGACSPTMEVLAAFGMLLEHYCRLSERDC